MGRTVLSVFAGYVVMVGVVLATMGVLIASGAVTIDSAGPQVPRTEALGVMLAGSAVAAVAGGAVAARLGRGWRPAIALAVLVAVMGVISALSPQYPTDTPIWYLAGIPAIGLAGVVCGARLVLAR